MWDPRDKNDFLTNTTGQITPEGEVGKAIMNCLQTNTLKNIVDIGTWNGLGSTRCFLLSLSENTKFFTIETNKEKHELAKKNLSNLITENCTFLHGSILRVEEITELERIFPEIIRNTEFRRWHALDIQNIKLSPNVLDKIPSEIDFILFDGGEFTTYYEFKILFPRCKKFIALDDVNVSKCKLIRRLLQNNSEWKEVQYIPERNGFSLFQHI